MNPECTCTVSTDGLAEIIRCPMHKAAPDLLKALKYAVEALDVDRWRPLLGTDWMGEAKAAINKAKSQ